MTGTVAFSRRTRGICRASNDRGLRMVVSAPEAVDDCFEGVQYLGFNIVRYRELDQQWDETYMPANITL